VFIINSITHIESTKNRKKAIWKVRFCEKIQITEEEGKTYRPERVNKMQSMRHPPTQKYIISFSCMLIFLSNATIGNSSEEQTFQGQPGDYAPLTLQLQPNIDQIRNNRLTAETLYKQLQLLDRLITHHHPFSRTSQLERLYIPKSKDEDEVLRNKRDDDNEELQEEHHPYLFGNPISQHFFPLMISQNRPPFEHTLSDENEYPKKNNAKRNWRPFQRKKDGRNKHQGHRLIRPAIDINPNHFKNGNSVYKNSFQQNDGTRNKEREGMTISVTQNLDILRRRILKEIALRERQRTQKEVMMKNKGLLGNIGK